MSHLWQKDTLEHITLFCVNPQISWASMVERYKQLTGRILKRNVQLCLLGKVNNENTHLKLISRLASITLWWICKSYYERKDLKTSWEIGRELNEMYRLGDRVQLGERWKNRNLDVEIDSAALREKIISLSEAELRRGEGNLVIWLRNQFGNLSEPRLEREDGFKGVRYFPKIVGDIGNRKTNLTKLEYLLALDNRALP